MKKIRDFHKLRIVRREARGFTSSIPSKKKYSRKIKHKRRAYANR